MTNHEFRVLCACICIAWVTQKVGAQDCAHGTEPDGSGGCANCPAGTISSSADNSSCAPCPVGSYAAQSATTCNTCTPGLYDHDQSAITACEYCPVGRFALEDGAVACEPCQDGSRWVRVHGDSEERPSECAACPPGYFELEPGARYCEACPPGSYSPAVFVPEHNLSQPAPAGPCEDDPDGDLAALSGSCDAALVMGCNTDLHTLNRAAPVGSIVSGLCPVTCDACLADEEPAPIARHSGCVSCAPGQYDHDRSPMTECLPCPQDTYSNKTGALECYSCPPGQFSPIGSLTVDSCGVAATATSYLGCYKDGPDEWDTVLVEAMGDIDLMTESRTVCSFICSNYKYMALTWTSECRCGNRYGSAGPADLNDDGSTQCGENGMNCGVGKPQRCPFIASIYTVSRTVTCAHVGDICMNGTTLKANPSSILADPDPAEQQSTCCETSCASWGAANECSSGSFIADAADQFPIGDSPQLACCTNSCAVGHVVDEFGRCHICPAGRSPSASGIECEPCGAGSYVPAGSRDCAACPAGQYDDDYSSTTPCVDCLAGQYTNAPGWCNGLCPTGTYSPPRSVSADDCEECAAGQHDHDNSSATPCLSCPAGTFAPDARTCLPCPANTFSSLVPTSTCASCPAGRFSEPQTVLEYDCECPIGQFPGREYAGRKRDAAGLVLNNECVSCGVGTQHASQIPKCPKRNLMLEWHGTSRYTPDGYPTGYYPTSHWASGMNEFDPYEIHNMEVVAADPPWGCAPLYNAAEVAGKAVLIHRGNCLFGVKLENAEQAGASAMLMINDIWTHPGGSPIIGTWDRELSIPGISPMIVLSIHRDIGYELREAIINSTTCTGTADMVPGSCSDGNSDSQEACESTDCSGVSCEWTSPITPTCDMILRPGVPANGPEEQPTFPAAHCPAGCDVTFPDGPTTISLNCGEPCPYGDLCDGVCFPCDPGSIDHDNDPSTACVLCPEMTYQSAAGALECFPCPFGQVSNEGASECSTAPLYLGCFEDRLSLADSRDLTGEQFRLERETNQQYTSTEECALNCAGYSYMGLQGALLCFCGNEYGTYEQLEDGQCGDSGDLCGDSDEDTCMMQNAVFRIPQWRCVEVTCDAGTALVTSKAFLSVLGRSRDEQQEFCCAPSCAAWKMAGNTCEPLPCEDDPDGDLERFGGCAAVLAMFGCAAAPLGTPVSAICPVSCDACLVEPYQRFVDRQSENTAAGSDPRAACCTEPCTAGQKNDNGQCEDCAAGTMSTETDATSCPSCAIGEYAPEGASMCSRCVEGQYDHDLSPTTPCQQCPAGTFSSVEGATSCDGECPPGTTGVAGALDAEGCVECAPGQHDHDSDPATSCLLCPRGQFTNAVGQVMCESCITGQVSAGGSAFCTSPEQPYAASSCRSQWSACINSANCIKDIQPALAAIIAPTRGSTELLALLQCMSESTMRDDPPPGGCLDPSGSNYDDTKAADDGSCVYECAVLSPSDSGNSICYIYSIDTAEWTAAGTQQSFADNLMMAEHVVIQGNKIYEAPPEGSMDWSQYASVHPSEITESAALGAWLAQPPQAGCNYEWFNDPKHTWHDARDECISRGGDLASIHSEEDQQAAMIAITRGNGGENTDLAEITWIGGNDERNEMGCTGGHGPVDASTRVNNVPEQSGVNFPNARSFGQVPSGPLYGGAGVTGPVANVQTDVWEWADGSPWDWTAWLSHAGYGFTAPVNDPQQCDSNAPPVQTSCGVEGMDHVHMNFFRDGSWSVGGTTSRQGTCRTQKAAYLCGYPCGPSWTAPLVTQVTLPSFAERFDLVGQDISLRSVRLLGFEAVGGGSISLGAVIDATSGSDVNVEHVWFSNNVQKGVGAGLIYVDSSELAIRFSEIRGSRNLGSGAGVIYARRSNVTIRYTNVIDSISETSIGRPGLTASVMVLESCDLAVVGTLFEGNTGANTILAVDSALHITSTAFVKNTNSGPTASLQQNGAAPQSGRRLADVGNPCDGGVLLDSTSGTISFMDGYPQSMADCHWTIVCPADGSPVLTFDQLHTERDYDFVDVFSGEDTAGGASSLLGTLHGRGSNENHNNFLGPYTTLSQAYNIPTRSIHIHLRGDSSVARSGFAASWQCAGSVGSGATLSLFDGSVAVVTNTSFNDNVGWYTGGLFVANGAAPVVLQEVSFSRNAAENSEYGGGAIAMHDAAITAHSCSFDGNSASSQMAAGAILSTNARIVLSDVVFSGNIAGPSTGLQVAGGAILSTTDTLELIRASFVSNYVNSGPDSTSWTGAEALYVVTPNKVKIVDTEYSPFVDTADEGLSVLISPGAIRGVLQAGCNQHPCPAGSRCIYANYSISCHRCPEKTYSSDGITCQLCPPGFGPADDQTGCIPCTGNNYSSFGVCQPCPSALVSVSGSECKDCGVHRTAIQSSTPNTRATCGCQDNYYNSSGSDKARLHVCFVTGYDRGLVEAALKAQRDNMESTDQVCQTCPTDIAGEKCLVCANGAQPTMAAGYTVPQLGDHHTASRRALQSSDGPGFVGVFRCHVEMELAVKRCPLNPDYPGQCAQGYTGKLCDSCIDGYGMDPSRECAPCENAGYTPESFALLGIIIAALVLVSVCVAKIWKAFPLKYIPRCIFQPVRIIITYSQVTSQLGDVLDFTYPGIFGDILHVLKPAMDLWGLLFRALGPSECFGISGFTAKWLLRVLGLPTILGVIVLVVWAVDRYRFGPIKAQVNMKAHVFLAVFFSYPTICIVCFASFICKTLGQTEAGEAISVLSSDDSVFCDDPSHQTLQVVSAMIIAVVGVGLPLTSGYVLLRASRQYEQDTSDKNLEAVQHIAKELDVDENQAVWVVRDLVIGRDYSFLMDAYSPKYIYWEALDMLRKFALVGLVLLVGRGTIAQLGAGIVLSFGFMALQIKTWPYKLEMDNLLRTATEMHVCIAIVTALILKHDLSWERVGIDVYDYVLFLSFIVLVPVATVLAVCVKVRHVSRLMTQKHDTDNALHRCQVAYGLQRLGLADDQDIIVLKRYLETIQMEVASMSIGQVVDGTRWAKNGGSAEARTGASEVSDSESDLDFEAEREVPTTAVTEHVSGNETLTVADSNDDVNSSELESDQDSSEDCYYDKFTGGFEGTFANLSDYFGGLERLIGECRKDLMVAMKEEHCMVTSGYGASDERFETSSYRVVTTPREEWQFVAEPTVVGEMDAGVDRETGRSRGYRQKVPVGSLLESAAELITKSFQERGFDIVITRSDVCNVGLRIEEVIAMRLYTGPMFEIYNGLLRAYGNRAGRGIVPSYALVGAGQDVRGRFTTTLHVLNSGVLKLAKLQPAIPVYRGISGMKLPKSFTKKNKLNVRGGVEYGFMSTTTDENVALSFAKAGDRTSASTLVVASMGMIDRGATLDWLSQYPHEREVLLPPLTAMEVVDVEDFVDSGAFQIRKLHIRLNTNLVSMTIENLLSARKKQVSELIDIVAKDISNQDEAADMKRRSKSLRTVQAKLKRQPSDAFNINQIFLQWTQRKVLDLMPQMGNCIQELHGHTRDVYGLVQTDLEGFVTSSWDGTLRTWSLGDDFTYASSDEHLIKLPSATLSLAAAGFDHIVCGHLNGTVSVHNVSRTDASKPMILSHGGSSAPVSALAVRIATSPLRTGDVIVNIADETPTLIPERNLPVDIWIACGSMDGSISLWQVGADTKRNKLVQCVQTGAGQDSHVENTSTVRAMVWSRHGGNDVLISGSFDHQIVVWRLTSNNQLDRHITLGGKHCAHDGAVTALACIDDASRASIVSAGEDGVFKLWDLDMPTQPTRVVQLRGKGICSLAWLASPVKSGDDMGGWLACGMGDNSIVVCEPETGKQVATMRGHSGAVHTLLWLETKGWLVSGSSDATVRTWRVR